MPRDRTVSTASATKRPAESSGSRGYDVVRTKTFNPRSMSVAGKSAPVYAHPASRGGRLATTLIGPPLAEETHQDNAAEPATGATPARLSARNSGLHRSERQLRPPMPSMMIRRCPIPAEAFRTGARSSVETAPRSQHGVDRFRCPVECCDCASRPVSSSWLRFN